ncbi:MAG: HAD family hydrolase [Fodinibius sp.]|nr:HAD family hydrolase [Fodinibius sp.]
MVQRKLEEGGIVLRSGTRSIEQLAKVNHIIFDKTGTLTQKARLENLTIHTKAFSKHRLLCILAGLEATQQHPIARAVRAYASKNGYKQIQLTDIQPIPGLGLKATWQET